MDVEQVMAHFTEEHIQIINSEPLSDTLATIRARLKDVSDFDVYIASSKTGKTRK
jgi:hypothetical protein